MPSKKNDLKKTEEKVQTAAMRHPALYVLSIIILVVIVVTFIIGPVLTRSGGLGSNSTVFGTFRGEAIELVQGTNFARVYQSQLDSLITQAEQQGRTPGLQEQYTALRNAYSASVFRLALLDEAERAGLYISDQEVTDSLINSGSFNDDNGSFSVTAFREALEFNPGLRDDFRQDLVYDRVRRTMIDQTSLSEAEITFIAEMGDKRRVFDIVSFEFSDFPDSELDAYLSENPELFQRAEISSITLNSIEDAEEARQRLEDGEISFEELAAEVSTDLFSADGGSRGTVWYYDIQRDFQEPAAADILYGLAQGEASEIFEIRGEKYAIFRLDSEVTAAQAGEEEVLQQVRGYVLSLERGLVSDYFRQTAESFTDRAEEIGWASALVESGLEATTTSAVGINYGNLPLFPNYESASAGILSGVSSRETLIADLFSLELGQLSDAVELSDRIAIIRYAEEGEQTSGQNDFLRLAIPYQAQGYTTSELQRIYNSPEYLRDNFDQAFQNVFLGGN
jgi:hypothetical protein